MMLWKRESRPRRGAAAVEFVLVVQLLIVLALWCVDYGRYAYYSIAVQNAARAGAEYGVMNSYTSAGQSAWSSAVQTAAINEMKNQKGYTSGALSVTPTVTVEASGLRRIQVTATYTGFTTLPWPGIPQNPTLTATIVMRVIR